MRKVISDINSDVEGYLERAPERLLWGSNESVYSLKAKLIGGDGITRKAKVNLRDLMAPVLDDFYHIIRIDEHPFVLEKLTINVKNKSINV